MTLRILGFYFFLAGANGCINVVFYSISNSSNPYSVHGKILFFLYYLLLMYSGVVLFRNTEKSRFVLPSILQAAQIPYITFSGFSYCLNAGLVFAIKIVNGLIIFSFSLFDCSYQLIIHESLEGTVIGISALPLYLFLFFLRKNTQQ